MLDRNNLISEINKDNIIGSAIISSNSHIIIADEVIYSFLGTSQSIAIADYIHPDYKDEFWEHLKNSSYTPVSFITKCRRYKGDCIDVSMVMQNKDIDGKHYINIDIYDIFFMTREYRNFITANKIFNALVSMSDKIFFRYETKNKQMYVYSAQKTYFSGSLNLYRSTMTENKSIEYDHMQQFQQMCDAIENASGDGFYRFNTNLFDPTGKEYNPTVVNFTTIEFNSQIESVVGTFTGSAGGSGSDNYVAHRSNLDPLTNLLNKKAIKDYALEALTAAAKNNTHVTLVMIDLDNFKTINDTYGHMFGDETLVNVARVMNEAVGDRGVVGRIGGDEFFIVLTEFENGTEAIRPLIRSIRSHVEWCFKNKIEDIKVTCSVGTATYPEDAQTYDDLFRLADHCLYIAKSKGRDRFIIYTRSMHGSLDDILSGGTVIQMANYVPETDKQKHLLSLIQRFNSAEDYSRQQVVLKKVMLELLYYYDIDAVQYCPVDADKQYYEVTHYTIDEPRALIELYDEYKTDLNRKGYVTIGNYENAKVEYPPLYQYMIKTEVYSMMIIPHTDHDGNVIGIFTVSTYKRYQKWAAFDINMLLVICRLMERFIK